MSEKPKQPKTLFMTIQQYDFGLKFLESLRSTYPKCFMAAGYEKPLKKGIPHDLMMDILAKYPALDFKKVNPSLTSALRIYTSSLSYRAALIREGSQRVDILGNPVEPVTAIERTHAKFRPLELKWKLEKAEYPIVEQLRQEARAYRQEAYEKWKAKQPKAEAVIIPVGDESMVE